MKHKDDAYVLPKTCRRSWRNSHRPYMYGLIVLISVYLLYRWVAASESVKRFGDVGQAGAINSLPNVQVLSSGSNFEQVVVFCFHLLQVLYWCLLLHI